MKLDSGLTCAAVRCMARPRASSLTFRVASRARISATVGFASVATPPPAGCGRRPSGVSRRVSACHVSPSDAFSGSASARKVSRLISSPPIASTDISESVSPTSP